MWQYLAPRTLQHPRTSCFTCEFHTNRMACQNSRIKYFALLCPRGNIRVLNYLRHRNAAAAEIGHERKEWSLRAISGANIETDRAAWNLCDFSELFVSAKTCSDNSSPLICSMLPLFEINIKLSLWYHFAAYIPDNFARQRLGKYVAAATNT
jgi:hypothetical protein